VPRSRIYQFRKPEIGQIMSGRHRSHPRYRGCVGHWIMAAGGGLTAYDISGNNRHGTLTNGPVWAVGQFGNALDFDGTNDRYLDVGIVNPTGGGTSDWTISAWVQRLGGFGTRQGIIGTKSAGAGSSAGWNFGFHDGAEANLLFTVIANGASQINIVGATTVTDSNWHHVAVTLDRSGNGQPYLDGVADGSPTSISSFDGNDISSSNTAAIAARNVGSIQWEFIGRIDELRLYDRALSPSEILSLRQNPFFEFEETHRRVYVFVPAAPGVGFDIFQRARMDGLGGRKSKDMSGL
jgi:hypothetical protein